MSYLRFKEWYSPSVVYILMLQIYTCVSVTCVTCPVLHFLVTLVVCDLCFFLLPVNCVQCLCVYLKYINTALVLYIPLKSLLLLWLVTQGEKSHATCICTEKKSHKYNITVKLCCLFSRMWEISLGSQNRPSTMYHLQLCPIK